jgi:hypothetical protein
MLPSLQQHRQKKKKRRQQACWCHPFSLQEKRRKKGDDNKLFVDTLFTMTIKEK